MDSRAKSLLEKIAAFGDPEGQRGRALASVRSWSKEAAALLTAEPELCEDYEDWLKTQADGPWNINKDDSGNYTDYSTALVFRGFVAAQHFATQVADKQTEELRLETTTLRELIASERVNNDKRVEALRAQVETLRKDLEDTTGWVESFYCQCDPETGTQCPRCFISWRNREALAATEPKP